MRLKISREVLAGIGTAAATAYPEEACGLLFGGEGLIDGWQEARNVAKKREMEFEIDPSSLFAALREERRGGPNMIGYWHSHPNGRPSPSPLDCAAAALDGKYWLIVTAEGVTAWRAVGNAAGEVAFATVRLESG